jgi:hypothetical protein
MEIIYIDKTYGGSFADPGRDLHCGNADSTKMKPRLHMFRHTGSLYSDPGYANGLLVDDLRAQKKLSHCGIFA